MKDKRMIGTIIVTILVIALAVIFVSSFFISRNYVIVDWQLFPKGEAQLDLRNRAISLEDFDELGRKIPGTEILWSIPLSGSYYTSDSREITLTRLDASELGTLDYFPDLEVVNAEHCTDYAALAAAYARYPEITFRYTVPVSGIAYAPDTTTVTLTSLTQEDISMLEVLPCLTKVDGQNCREYDLLQQIARSHPEWEVTLLTSIAGTEISSSTTQADITGATYKELSVGLAAMPNLKELTLHAPQTTGAELVQLREEYPGVDIHWDITVFGTTFSDDATEVDVSAQPIGSIEEAKRIGALFPNLEKLIVDSTGIDNEDMAAYRDEVRSQYKVVWTVIFTDNCKARTDETYFMPIKQGEYYFEEKNIYNLRFCEDMVCIDIGHSTVKTIDFAAYMPHLKYLILAWTQVEDITPLQNCKELIYLELDHGIVHDFTPLLGCTALEDLNITDHMWGCSLEPITQMTWLKNLYAMDYSYVDQQLLINSLPNTRVVTTVLSPANGGWRGLQNYYDMRDYLGMYYMD